jgi:hypothetical protein
MSNRNLFCIGAALLLLCASGRGNCQTSPPNLQSPQQVKQALEQWDTHPQPQLVSDLKLQNVLNGEACSNFSNIRSEQLWQRPEKQLMAIRVDSDCLIWFLIVFESKGAGWRYVGTIPLWMQFATPKYYAAALMCDGTPGIVINDLNINEGTGFWQQNMQIFTVIEGKLRVVFNEPETIRFNIPFKPDCCPYTYRVQQRSKFKLNPPKSDNEPASIDETRHEVVNGHTVTLLKVYTWSRALQTFNSYATAPSLISRDKAIRPAACDDAHSNAAARDQPQPPQ